MCVCVFILEGDALSMSKDPNISEEERTKLLLEVEKQANIKQVRRV